MNRFTRTLIKVGAIATLAAGSYALPALALAAAPSNAVTITSADIQAKADQYGEREPPVKVLHNLLHTLS